MFKAMGRSLLAGWLVFAEDVCWWYPGILFQKMIWAGLEFSYAYEKKRGNCIFRYVVARFPCSVIVETPRSIEMKVDSQVWNNDLTFYGKTIVFLLSSCSKFSFRILTLVVLTTRVWQVANATQSAVIHLARFLGWMNKVGLSCLNAGWGFFD